jgi:glycosyltransferase involved in cell wall biosynthesis
MRVTFVIASADLTGGCRVISIHAENLRKRGHEVHVVIRPPRRVDFLDQVRALLRREPVPRTPKHWLTHYDPLIGRPGVTIRAVDRHRPITAADLPDADVIVATWWETAEWIADVPPSKGAKAYFIQHYEAHFGQDRSRVDATWRLPMHKITIAQWLVDLARDRFGQTGVWLVPNAVDTQQFHAAPRGKQPIPTVGLMYSDVPFKACHIGLKAVELAKQRVPSLRLVAFGDGPVKPHLPLPEGCDYTMLPAQDRIKEIYARCDAWLLASRSEGNALPLLEAMACRTPVIATPAGAAPELIAPGGGVLVPIDDAEAMAREIERVVSLPPDAWRKMSDIAHATANGYSWEQATDLFEAALQAAVKTGQ